ncbi:MAG TPA: MoaD/ThiS family protein [Acidimicrobiales bacterium]
MFGPAREAAGEAEAHLAGDDVAEVLGRAEDRYGAAFAAVLGISRIWINEEPATGDEEVEERDEIAVLPPVSGG